MSTITDYLETLNDTDHEAIARIYDIAQDMALSAVPGISYGMPALLLNGKGLVSVMKTKKFLSLYPFSGQVGTKLADDLKDFERTSGSIHFSAEHPIPDDLIRKIISARLDELVQKA